MSLYKNGKEPLAIIGIGCRFPGNANTPAIFWDNLCEGKNAVKEVPKSRWNAQRYYHSNAQIPGKMITRWGGFLDTIADFDASFFGISPREALRIDPQQRWLLEVTWEALEDGGISPNHWRGSRTGVFIGISSNDYATIQTKNPAKVDLHTNSGSTLSIASGRLSYIFDFKGPSLSVDTACSSALVAVHLACQSIWKRECDAAIAGGVNALLTPDSSIGFSKAAMLSPSGCCFAFDKRADGYVRGEGAGAIVLKPLKSALKDGNSIYAIIHSTVVNQDGHTSSMTVPGQASQEAMLREAYILANIAPKAVGYVEAHGTGTPVGDPIEARAIGNVLSQNRPDDRPCLIGSVKTNIGHLESASGIAGIIKTALILKNQRIPPNLHFQNPNPDIPFAELRLRVPTEKEPFPSIQETPAIAAVNSFGFGGTNAHVVLARLPSTKKRVPFSSSKKLIRPYLLPVSARSSAALKAYAQCYRTQLSDIESKDPAMLRDFIWSAGKTKSHHSQRLAITGRSLESLLQGIEAFLAGQDQKNVIIGQALTSSAEKAENTSSHFKPQNGIVFVFTGQGPQWWGMAHQLIKKEPVFRKKIEQCSDLFSQYTSSWSLLEEVKRNEATSRINETDIAQPAIFALQVALIALWESWGIKPSVVVGHSVGEAAAAYAAGIYSLEDAVQIIYHRSRLQNTTRGKGRMCAVALSEKEASEWIKSFASCVAVAAVNSPHLVTLAGDSEAVAQVAKSAAEKGIFCRDLGVDYAFHTFQMEPIREALLESLRSIQSQSPTIPFYSTVTGGNTVVDYGALYWWQNVRQTVRFSAAINTIIKEGYTTFLELGPHPSLKSALNECLTASGRSGVVLGSLRRKEDDSAALSRTLAVLYTDGYLPDWEGFLGSKGNRVSLPAYPWQKETYWLESDYSRAYRLDSEVHPLLGLRQNTPQPTWELLLDARAFPYLQDHRLRDSLVFPASAYVEMALAAAQELFPEKFLTIENITFLKALFLSPDQTVKLRLSYDKSNLSFKIHSALDSAPDDWQLNAQGYFQKIPPQKPIAANINAVRSSLTEQVDHAAIYDDLEAAGYQFGDCFQEIQTLWRRPNESLGQINVPESIQTHLNDYQFQPAILDACFQCVKGAQEIPETADPSYYFYLPTGLKRICLYQKPGRMLFAHARLLNESSNNDDEYLKADICVYNENGEPVADIRAFQCRRVDHKNATQTTSYDDALYRFCWEKEPLTAKAVEQTEEDVLQSRLQGQWIIFSNQSTTGDTLVQTIESQGGCCYSVFAGKTFEHIEKTSFQIHPENPEHLQKFFAEVGISTASFHKLKGIIHLWNLDLESEKPVKRNDLENAQKKGCIHLTFLTQALIGLQGEAALNRNSPKEPQDFNAQVHPRVWIVTHGDRENQDINNPCQLAHLFSAPTRGFAYVAHSEIPAFRWTLIQLDSSTDVEAQSLLCDEVLSYSPERDVILGKDGRWVRRLQPVSLNEIPFLKKAVTQSGKNVDRPMAYRLKINQPGILKKLTLNETTRSEPGDYEIEIAVKAAGLNFRDVMKAMGIYPGNDVDQLWLGDECAGIVVSVGKKVTRFKAGDTVIAIAPYCFRAYAVAHESFVLIKPEHITFEEAATLPIAFLTAHYAFNWLAHLQPGEKVLIHAGAGGVGQAAIQVAQQIGAEVFATAGSKEKREHLESQGVQHVLNSRSLDFADEIQSITQDKGVDVVLNSLAGAFLPKTLGTLGPYGRFLEIGKVDIYQNTAIGLEPFKKNLSFFAIDLAACLRERPKVIAKMLVELQEHFEQQKLRPLPHKAFSIAQTPEAFRHMAQARHIGKIVLSTQTDSIMVNPPDNAEPVFKEQAAYLITGGLSGFGLETAKWMAAQGARHLFLMGRSGAKTEEAQTVLQGLRDNGVQLEAIKADVTQRQDLKRVLEIIRAKELPLKGVIHGAMILDDGFIHQLNKDRFDKVLAPKMIGAWLLHEATREEALDYFICFSSISSVIGGAGQANYNAANAFLDALAHYRRSLGLPALTLNWAPLAGAGYVARNTKVAKYLSTLGLESLEAKEALAIMSEILRKDINQVAVARIDWQKLSRLNPTVMCSPTFSSVLQHGAQHAEINQDHQGADNIRASIMAAKADKRTALLENYICEQVAQVFGAASDKIDREMPLTQVGLDSLMAVELMNRIETHLAIKLPMGKFLQGPNIKQLAPTVLEILLGTVDDATKNEAVHSSPVEPKKEVPVQKVVASSDHFELSYGQSALWFIHQLAPGSPAYNLVFSSKINPALDSAVVKDVLEQLAQRHPVLSATFSTDVKGQPVQKMNSQPILFREHDCARLEDSQIRKKLFEQANQPFDLKKGPIARVDLFRTKDNSHYTLLSMHHIVSDAWSVALIMNDLIEGYLALSTGQAPKWDVPEYDYRDYVDWQKRFLETHKEPLGDYWEKQLKGSSFVLDLPTDHPRPPVQSFNGATYGFTLENKLTQSILSLTRQYNTTLYTILLSSFQILLHRYCQQEDIIVGSPFAGRNHPKFQQVAGYFINPVPLRSRVDDNPSFDDYLNRIGQTVIEAIEYQDYPLSYLVDQLNVPRDPSRSPLFQVTFSMERVPGVDEQGIAVFLIGQGGHKFEVGNLSVESIDLNLKQAQFEISLSVEEANGQLYGCWLYNRDLFDETTIAHLSHLYRSLLQEIVAAPDKKIMDYTLFPQEDAHKILFDWNKTQIAYPDHDCLHSIIEEKVTAHPDKPAIIYAGETLSYAQLERRANGVAQMLSAQGIGLEDRVSVLLDPTPDRVIALLGILKAGACYVPLDPAFPGFRLKQILNDVRPSVLLTHTCLKKMLSDFSEIEDPSRKYLFIDQIEEAASPPSISELTAEALAYIIYTSGSTGRPKGIEIPHRAVVNFLSSMARDPGLDATDRLLAVTTFSFDISVLELFLPLFTGAVTVIAEQDAIADGQKLAALLEKHAITIMQATPATWQLLLDSGWTGKKDLRALCGGDTLSRPLAETLLTKTQAVWNLYGPTETTIWSTLNRVHSETGAVSIGRPIANTSIFILDAYGRPVPPLFPGQLYIGGHGLARGYHNQPSLTKERFIEAAHMPILNGRAERLYRTGDIARYHLDGRIEFLGRGDHQIKLRGYRIELEDIETQLIEHPEVDQVVVIKHDDSSRGAYLAAYFVTHNGIRKSLVSELKMFISERLPDYMRPSVYQKLPAFPLTPNRKIDRLRLPAPVLDRESITAEYTAPRSPSEMVICDILNQTFDTDTIGIYDNFFDLGGDSLRAVQVLALVSKAFNRDLEVAIFLQNPTVERLAHYLDTQMDGMMNVPLEASADSSLENILKEAFSKKSVNGHHNTAQITKHPDPEHQSFSFIDRFENVLDDLPKIDAAAIAYIPEALLQITGWDARTLIHDGFDNRPWLSNLYTTPYGRIGLISLPQTGADLYKEPDVLRLHLTQAIKTAGQLGAKTVSLTGLIPSATNYGREVNEWLKDDKHAPVITNGHATTTATMVKTIQSVLSATHRDLPAETVAFLGLGSIGSATLRLMLNVLPHPKAIILCDLYQKVEALHAIQKQIVENFNYTGDIYIEPSRSGRLPDMLYTASFIIGATSIPGILDIWKLEPGTLIVDDSYPPCFRLNEAIHRFEKQSDLFFTNGGRLRLPECVQETIYLPATTKELFKKLNVSLLNKFSERDAYELTGCIFSSLLTHSVETINPTFGLVSCEEALKHYNQFDELSLTAASFRCEYYALALEKFIGSHVTL